MSVPQPALHEPAPNFLISYHREDSARAELIASQLKQAGASTTLMETGASAELQTAAASASRILAVLSPDYLEFLGATQWAHCDPDGKKLIGVQVRSCKRESLPTEVIDLVDLGDSAAREALLHGLGLPSEPVQAPPPFSLEAFTVKYPQLIRLEEADLELTFVLRDAGTELFVTFDQDSFSIRSRDGHGCPEANRFRFQFPTPGTWVHKLSIGAKKDANDKYPITAFCRDAGGKSLANQREVVGVSKPWWIFIALENVLSALRFIGRHPLTSAASVLAVMLVSAGVTFSKMAPDKQRELIDRAWQFISADYLSSSDHKTWTDSFETEDGTKKHWILDGAAWHNYRLEINRNGFAVADGLGSASFYDFDALFQVTVPPGGNATWAFRVNPHAATTDIRRSRGYRFDLFFDPADATILKIRGLRCTSLSNGCTQLGNEQTLGQGLCLDNSTVSIKANVHRDEFTFEGRVISEQACDDPVLGKVPFSDKSALPRLRYGSIAFLNKQTVWFLKVSPVGGFDELPPDSANAGGRK